MALPKTSPVETASFSGNNNELDGYAGYLMILPEITERLSKLIGLDRSSLYTHEVVAITPRPLSDLERSWIHSMLEASHGWESTNLAAVQVIAEGPNSQGISFVLQDVVLESPAPKPTRHSIAQLWIQTSEQLTINVQLSEWEGQLVELYVLIIDVKHSRKLIRTLPNPLVERSREAVGFST